MTLFIFTLFPVWNFDIFDKMRPPNWILKICKLKLGTLSFVSLPRIMVSSCLETVNRLVIWWLIGCIIKLQAKS